MALARSNPIPAGRYWITVHGDKRAGFDAWVQSNTIAGLVRVLSTEAFDTYNWFLFEVVRSGTTFLDFTTFGYPTIAAPSVTSSSDVVQAPAPQTSPSLSDTIGNVALWGGILFVGYLVIASMAKTSPRKTATA